jgi:hypothetical protein
MPTTLTRDQDLAIDDAAEILESHGIILYELGADDDLHITWSKLVAEHGERVALAKHHGGEYHISWQYTLKPVAWRIRQAFRAVGMRATWSGEEWDVVLVDLTIRGTHR